MMRAWMMPKNCRSVDDLEMIECAVPVPAEKDVLIRVRAGSINYRDQLIPKGLYFGGPISGPGTPLSDGVGVIEAVGRGVSDFDVGDRVAGTFFQGWSYGPPTPHLGDALGAPPAQGMLADYVCLPSSGVVKLAETLTFDEAATLPCAGVTAWNALMGGIRPLRPGHKVLLIGTGGVSVLAMQIAKAAGAYVIATSSSDAKLERMREMGADALINYRNTTEWGAEAARMSGGGVDHVVEVGGPGTLAQSMQAVGFGGEIALIGVLSVEGDTNPMPLMVKSASLRGIFVGSAQMARDLNGFIDQFGIKPVVDARFDFADAKAAYSHQASAASFGKTVITNGA
jgi:NADPH:quinone reductase-like Zn-dependent oxidoreductase